MPCTVLSSFTVSFKINKNTTVIMRNVLVIIIYFTSFWLLNSQKLERRATFQAKIEAPRDKSPGAKIISIEDNSSLKNIGLKENDILLKVNDRQLISYDDWSAVLYDIRAKEKTQLVIKREFEVFKKEVVLEALPLEVHTNIETYYEYIVNDFGMRQRVIITKPKDKNNLPAIFLVQGLSCSSVEKYSERSNNWVRLINDLVEKSNMVLYRIEKPGVGDSDGDCGKTDFKTELNGYENAIEHLKSKSYVNKDQIIVYGNSMGSALAPYLANKFNLAGIISDGTFFKSWYEHMLEIERRILEIEGKSQEDIYELMNTVYIPLYYEMLIKKRSFDDIIKDNPRYAEYHRQGLNHMYGRSMAYYYQVQDFNFAKEWESIKVPVRIRWGTNDWIMTGNDNDMIISVLENNNHKDHKLFKYKDLDHWGTIHPNYENSFYFKPGKWEDKISQQIIDWAHSIIGKNK